MKKNITPLNVPSHVAIIMDGNGRWAKKRGLPRNLGHRAGVKTVKRIVAASKEIGIKTLTLYAFSTENWSRPENEVGCLFKLIGEYFNDSKSDFVKEGVRVRVVGERQGLTLELISQIDDIERATEGGSALTLNICFNYGGRQEIVTAVKSLIEKGLDITEDNLSKFMYVTDPDLIVRTSGEMRLSNFLLFEAAYSEFYFTDKLWPDFDKDELLKAVEEYSGRTRRYGKV